MKHFIYLLFSKHSLSIPKHFFPVQRQRSVYQLHVFLVISIGENVDVG